MQSLAWTFPGLERCQGCVYTFLAAPLYTFTVQGLAKRHTAAIAHALLRTKGYPRTECAHKKRDYVTIHFTNKKTTDTNKQEIEEQKN
jgi:hypothetical protein